MARQTKGATAIIGLGVGIVGFFFLSKQPAVQHLISVATDSFNSLLQSAANPQAQPTTRTVQPGDAVPNISTADLPLSQNPLTSFPPIVLPPAPTKG